MKVQYIYWSHAELRLLAENYPSVGLLGCMALMPHRSRSSILGKVNVLKLSKNFALSNRARFFSKVEKTDSCWNWLAQIDKFGYGNFSIMTKPVRAHRYSYEIHCGPIGPGLNICHTCDNPRCVNPAHLFPGTQWQNIQDMVQKGRLRNQFSPKGDALPSDPLEAK